MLVRLMQPKSGEIIQDPAASTGGFLIAAERAIRVVTDEYFTLAPKQQEFQLHHALDGLENVQGVYRLLLMNLFLHGIDSWHIDLGDTLSPDGAALPPADLILTNPPFGGVGLIAVEFPMIFRQCHDALGQLRAHVGRDRVADRSLAEPARQVVLVERAVAAQIRLGEGEGMPERLGASYGCRQLIEGPVRVAEDPGDEHQPELALHAGMGTRSLTPRSFTSFAASRRRSPTMPNGLCGSPRSSAWRIGGRLPFA